MKLGVHLGIRPALADVASLVAEVERLGFDSVWTGEAWGADAATTAAWAAAHSERLVVGTAAMQMAARSPAATAMTALTLDHLSGGRFCLGLGLSGPQVVEGWHGQPFTAPLGRTREYVEVLRAILARDRPVRHDGEWYPLPVPGGTGLGKPLRSMLNPYRPDLPIYLAATGPRNVSLAAEVADGWIPFLYAPRHASLSRSWLDEGFERGGREAGSFAISPIVKVAAGSDLAACRDEARRYVALYVGGMGARHRNFYAELVSRYGYADAAAGIQDLYLAGNRDDAAGGVPDELVDDVALVGDAARIRERLEDWRAVGVTTLIALADDVAAIRTLAEAAHPDLS